MRKRLPEFKLKLETILKERTSEELSNGDIIEELIKEEKRQLREEEPEFFKTKKVEVEVKSPRKDSSGSTRDEEKSPKKNLYNNNFDLGCKPKSLITLVLSDYYSSPKKATLTVDEIETSPIITKSHFQNYGLFEDISFSTNIPCFRFNSFYNESHDSPFDL